MSVTTNVRPRSQLCEVLASMATGAVAWRRRGIGVPPTGAVAWRRRGILAPRIRLHAHALWRIPKWRTCRSKFWLISTQNLNSEGPFLKNRISLTEDRKNVKPVRRPLFRPNAKLSMIKRYTFLSWHCPFKDVEGLKVKGKKCSPKKCRLLITWCFTEIVISFSSEITL